MFGDGFFSLLFVNFLSSSWGVEVGWREGSSQQQLKDS